MSPSVHELTTIQFKTALKNLKNVLNKSKKWGEPKKIDMSVFFQTRLAPDMFPLGKQIQISADIAKGCVARLTKTTAPTFEDSEQTFDQYIERIEKTIKFMETIKPEQFNEYETARIEFPWNPGKHMMGKDYLVQHAIPNFYFHLTACYAILRSNGVDLGKGDYLGEQNWKSN